MLSKNKIKQIRQLQQKKQRYLQHIFVVEGGKSVVELLQSPLKVKEVFGTKVFIQNHVALLNNTPFYEATADALSQAGFLKNNFTALALVEMPNMPEKPPVLQSGKWALALDTLQDPGNLGTIVRLADWFGFECIFCSEDTTDLYSPKTLMASMGSFARMPVFYGDLSEILSSQNLPVYGAFMEGHSLHTYDLKTNGGVVVIGNEANGISAKIAKHITEKLTIPAFGAAESLNASMAAAVFCDNIRRQWPSV